MAQIAAASGIAVGQIYRDFANKEAIIAAICEADLTVWLEEETLEAAVRGDASDDIRAWIERVCIKEPSAADRRLMCELLAEVGRNPIISQINRKADTRLRASLEAALKSLAPHSTAKRRTILIDFIISISWGLTAGMELFPDHNHPALRSHVAELLQREVSALDA